MKVIFKKSISWKEREREREINERDFFESVSGRFEPREIYIYIYIYIKESGGKKR